MAKRKRTAKKRPTRQPQSTSTRKASQPTSFWRSPLGVGSIVVGVLLIIVAVWLALSAGKSDSPSTDETGEAASGLLDTQNQDQPQATTPAAQEPTTPSEPAAVQPTADNTEKEPISMPTNPIDRNNMYSAPPAMQIDPDKSYVATISTAKGDIVVQLDAGAAPQTVNNFVFLSNEGFYDGLTFHRVEPGFVIQGGDPLGRGNGGPGYTVPAEIKLSHVEGAIAMARLGDQVNPTRASSGSQFYITLAPTPFLDGGYTAFGQVIEGMDVVQSIAIGDVIQTITISEE